MGRTINGVVFRAGHLSEAKKAASPSLEDPDKAQRRCLKCRKKFASSHKGNRLCPICNQQAIKMRSSIDY